MPPNYPHIAARIFNTPLMIHPGKLDAIIAGLGGRFGLPVMPAPRMYDSLPGERRKPGYRVHGNVAVLDIFGILTHRGAMDMADSAYLLGYQDVARMLDVATRDREVDAIVLAIDSPGGEVDGAFQLAEQIRRAATVKPVRAVVDGAGASAAYLLAAAARDITATQTAQVGSVGVVMRHVDFSQALAQDGVSVTLIYAGAHKADGNPFEALPAAVRMEFQARVNAVYEQFVAAVAGYRNLDAAKVRATEARTYLAAEALELGFINQIGTVDQVVASLIAATGGRSRVALQTQTKEIAMSDKQPDRYFTQEEVDRARAEGSAQAGADVKAQVEAARAEGRKEGATAERARVTGILAHAEAKERRLQAIKIATTTELSPEQAGALMAGTPTETAPAPGPGLALVKGPQLDPDGAHDDGAGEEYAAAQHAVARLTGRAPTSH
jgi:signal peptide peptidase SppA